MKRITFFSAFLAVLALGLTAYPKSSEAMCLVGLCIGGHHHHHGHHHHSGILDGLKHAGETIGKGASDTAKKVGKGLHQGAKATGNWVEQAAKDTGKLTEKAAKDTGNWFRDLANDFSKSPACAPMARCFANKLVEPMTTLGACAPSERPMCAQVYRTAETVKRDFERAACKVAGALMMGPSAGSAASAGLWATMQIGGCISLKGDGKTKDWIVNNAPYHAQCRNYRQMADAIVISMCQKDDTRDNRGRR